MLENTFWCEGGCSYECDAVSSAERKPNANVFEGGSWNNGYSQCQNIANRMSQKEALAHAQGAFFVAIVIVQWADLLICKTRWLSIRTQGMINSTMNFGLFFETLLAAWLCYCPPINIGLGTRNLRLVHWFPAMPFSVRVALKLKTLTSYSTLFTTLAQTKLSCMTTWWASWCLRPRGVVLLGVSVVVRQASARDAPRSQQSTCRGARSA